MVAVLGEKIDALLRHGLRQVPAPARRHAHERLKFRMKAVKEFQECRVHVEVLMCGNSILMLRRRGKRGQNSVHVEAAARKERMVRVVRAQNGVGVAREDGFNGP